MCVFYVCLCCVARCDDEGLFFFSLNLFCFFQTSFTALTFTFDVPWPIQMRSFSLSLNFINFDLVNILSNSACSFSIPFLDKMAVHVAVPLVLLVTILCARLPAYYLRPKNRKEQKALLIKSISTLSLIFYPGLCTRLFSSLKVVTVNGLASPTHSGRVLAVDYSVEAFGEHHMPFVYLTVVSMVVYVLGVPLCVYLALKANKKYLYLHGVAQDEIDRHHDVVDEFGTLYLQCEFCVQVVALNLWTIFC